MKPYIRANRGFVLVCLDKATHFTISVSETSTRESDGSETKKYFACLYAYVNVGGVSQDFLIKKIEIPHPDALDDEVKYGFKAALFNVLE